MSFMDGVLVFSLLGSIGLLIWSQVAKQRIVDCLLEIWEFILRVFTDVRDLPSEAGEQFDSRF